MPVTDTERNTDRECGPWGFVSVSQAPLLRSVLLLLGTAALLALALSLLWYAGKILLLTFAGVILAVFLWGLSDWLTRHSSLRYGWALAVVVLVLLGLLALLGWLLSDSLAHQSDQLIDALPHSIDQLENYLQNTAWGQILIRRLHQAGSKVPDAELVASARGVLTATIDAIVEAILVILVGIYGAATPEIYCNGLVRLFPAAHRPRMRQTLHSMGYTLWWWVLCRIVSMVWVGVTTTVVLWLLGVPLPLALGLLAGLLKFVPYLGPIAAAVPAVLMALTKSPWLALWVILLYWVLEMIDDHILMPLLNWGALWLPPALAIFAQVLFGALWGIVGVLFAMPVAAVLLTLVKLLYVEDALGDATEVPGLAPHHEPDGVHARDGNGIRTALPG